MDTTKELNYLASLYSATIRDAILQSYQWFLQEVPERQIVDALKSGGIQGLIDLAEDVSTEMANQVTPHLTDAWRDAGRVTISGIPSAVLTTAIGFDSLPINALTMAEAHRARFVHNISDSARDAVVEAVSESLITGENPKKTSRQFREAIGLTPSQIAAVNRFREGLQTLDPKILNMELRDHRYDPAIRRHIEQDIPFDDDYIDAVVERYRQRQLKWRAEMIGRTEAMRSIHMGEYEALNAAMLQGDNPQLSKMRRYWSHSADERVRAEHRRIPMMNPYGRGVNEPFDSPLGPIRYPGDPDAPPRNTINCRCAILYVYNPKYPNMTYAEAGFDRDFRSPTFADVSGRQAYELLRNRGDLEAVERLEGLLHQWRRRLSSGQNPSYWQTQVEVTESWLKRIYEQMGR